MKNRLILVEGIPGSGKTTIANKIKEYIQSKNIKTVLFNEGDAHPADMAWNAYVPMDEYMELLENYPEHAEKVRNNTSFEEGYAIIAYTKLGLSPKDNELIKYLEAHEVYDGRVDLDTFKRLHFKRWSQFAESADDNTAVIFECSYLQNHINELMGAHDKNEDYITEYMIELIKTVSILNPRLIYLSQPDVYETIRRVAKERVSSDKSKWDDWIDLVISYVQNSRYGQIHNLKGFDGAVEFFKARKKIELYVIDKLSIDKVIINNSEYDWDKVVKEVLSAIEL